MSKRMTPGIAKILAQQIREKLSTECGTMASNIMENVKASKDYKKFLQLRNDIAEMNRSAEDLKDKICEKHSNKVAKVRIVNWGNNTEYSVKVIESDYVDIESIKNQILLKDYFSDGTESAEDMVAEFVKHYLSKK